MRCPNCGADIQPEAAFCKYCGTRLAAASSSDSSTTPPEPSFPPEASFPPAASFPPEAPPGAGAGAPAPAVPAAAPPMAPPPGRSGGGRTLLIVLAVAMLVLVLAVAGVVAALVVFRSESSGPSGSVPSTVSEVTVETTPSVSSTSQTTQPASEQPDIPPYASGTWVELDLPELPEQAYYAVTSDAAAVFETQATFYAYMFDTGDLVHIPTELNTASWASLDGDQMVWWEAQYDENDVLIEEGIFSYRLPDGPRTELVTGTASVGFPLISEGYVTWLDGHESADNPEEYWELPIYGARIGVDGDLAGDPELLVENPQAFMLGDSTWTYDLSTEYLAWEDHAPTSGGEAGTWVMDRRSGERTFLGPITWRPSLSGTNISFVGEDGLHLRDLGSGEDRLIDPEGDWATLTPEFVIYLRGDYGADQSAWDIVTVGLDGSDERVVGRQTTPPWLGTTLSASRGHVAFADEDGVPHVFELQP